MNIQAICTDIDGTLLDSRRELSDRTISILKKAKDSVPVILASSRMPAAMRHLQRQLGIEQHPLICFNGGYVIRYEGDADKPRVLDSLFIPVEVCEKVLAYTTGMDIHISLYHEDNWYAPQDDAWTEKESRVTKVLPNLKSNAEVLHLWKTTGAGAHKIMCMGEERLMNALEENLVVLHEYIHVYRSKSTYIEIAPRRVSKASALSLVLKDYPGITMENVIAFGDNYNDIEMLQTAGTGVAVANARPEAKAAANEITLSNTEDGVAIVLEKYFL